jgi:hypothetical protein
VAWFQLYLTRIVWPPVPGEMYVTASHIKA